MTTIRKIVTSKIDGDSANNTSNSEVRPFGEMAVYIDTENNGGLNKLELLMFDGVRTHLRSKVLSKGTFYGGDADSGSQGLGIENFDTIKLIPDAELHYNDSDYGNDQYIVIDPTFPNHIHVRAGGAIDASNALLILGGELNNVSVSDSADQVEIRTNDTHTWLFGTDGGLTLPGDLHGAEVFLSGEQPEPIVIGHTLNITPAANASDKKFGFRIDQSDGVYLNSYLDMPTAENNKHVSISFALTDAIGPDSIGYIWNQGTDTNVTNLNNAFNIFANNTNIKLTTQGSDNNQSTWLFGTDGKLTVPANSSILTNETALKIATHPTTTYTFNRAYWEAVDEDITRVVTPTGNAQYFACTVTANQDGTYTVGGLEGNSFAPGNWFKVPGNELGGVTPANDIQITVATVDVDGVILTTTITGTAVSKQWQFGADGNLTMPGNLVIAGNTSVFGTDVALIQSTDDLRLLTLSSGANGAVSSVWVEDIGNVGTSNIAAVYANPTVGSKIVRIVVGQNGVGSGPNLWDFGTDGNLTLPQTNMNSSPAPTSLPGITWTDGTFQTGRTINVPEDQSMKLEFTSSQYGSGNLQIRNNGIKTSTQSISLETGNNSYFGFEGTYKEITFSESYGSIVFGTQTRNQTGHYNDIEIKSYSDGTNGNVYISAGGSPTNNRWTFKPNGTLVVPGAVQNTNYFEIKAGTVSDNTWNLGIDGSTVFPNNTLKGYCFTATNTVTNYLPQSSQFMYSDSPILGQISSIGGTWYIKGPGLVGWKQITAVQDNSGVALIVRIGSGNTPLGDGSEFPSGGGNVYTISQYLDLDLQVADKTWTFDQAGSLTLPQGSTLKGAGSLTVSTNYQPQLGPYTGTVSQSMTGNGYIVVGNILSDIFAGVNLNSLIGSTLVVAGQNNTVLGVTYLGFGNSQEEYSVQISGPAASATAGTGVAISITKAETKNDWIFGTDGNLILPANSDIVSSTGVGQLANRVSGTWTVTTGTNNYSFTVPINGAYQLWVRGNIPNGILSYIATVHVTNFNVPVLGTQRAWNYTGGGTPISLISMPAQIIGAEGTISTTTASGTTNNVFEFGISNTSASTQTVSWGYTRISQ